MTTTLCAALAAVAVWLHRPDDWVVVRCRLGLPTRSEPWVPPTSIVVAAATGGVILAIPSTASQLDLVAVAGAGLFGLGLRRRARQRAQAAAFRVEVAKVIRSASAELRAGVEPDAALHAAASDASAAWDPVHAAGGADVRTALQQVAATPGGASLAEVAAAWHLAEQAGAPLAVIFDRMVESLQADVELDREVAVEAGPARATARLMAVLPIFGLGLGLLLGVNPVAVLVGSGLGVSCLVAGLMLACGGVWWIERIVAALDGPGRADR